MWHTEHSIETALSAERLWETFVAIHTGRMTLPGGDTFVLQGPFTVGSQIAVTPAGQGTFVSEIVELAPAARYADRTLFDGLELTFRHTFTATAAGTRITHELVVDGAAADEVGPALGGQISADFPEQLQALVAAAAEAA
jgi:hypothetical protein